MAASNRVLGCVAHAGKAQASQDHTPLPDPPSRPLPFNSPEAWSAEWMEHPSPDFRVALDSKV
eukprot:1155816-Pelagomonas_calceolata.AAC.4